MATCPTLPTKDSLGKYAPNIQSFQKYPTLGFQPCSNTLTTRISNQDIVVARKMEPYSYSNIPQWFPFDRPKWMMSVGAMYDSDGWMSCATQNVLNKFLREATQLLLDFSHGVIHAVVDSFTMEVNLNVTGRRYPLRESFMWIIKQFIASPTSTETKQFLRILENARARSTEVLKLRDIISFNIGKAYSCFNY